MYGVIGPACQTFATGASGSTTTITFAATSASYAGPVIDDVVGGGFALVSPHGDPAASLTSEQRAWFASVGGACAHVSPSGALHDADGAYARWFAANGAAVALQRPDFAVFGTAKELAGASALVEALRARLEER